MKTSTKTELNVNLNIYSKFTWMDCRAVCNGDNYESVRRKCMRQ